MKLQIPFIGLSRLLVGVAVAFGFCASLSAQPLKAGEGQVRLVLDKDWATKESADELKQFQAIRRGEQPIPENKGILDRGAQWYAYRLTDSVFQDPKPNGKTLYDIRKEALEQIVDPKTVTRQGGPALLAFKEEFEKRFVMRLQEVTKNQRVVARVNAAIILAKLAEKGCEEAADVLVEIIKDPVENEGVKLWAFRGLGNLLALGYGENGTPMKNKEREARCIVALLDYVNAKPKLPESASTGEVLASTYVRREAIAALGQSRFPGVAIAVDKKTTKIDRMTALVLLKLMRSDEQAATPTMAEQVTAAIGICHLQAKLLEQYNPDYAAYQLGRFIADFSRQYREAGPDDKENKKRLPWKSFAARLAQALGELKNEGTNKESLTYIEKLCSLAEPLLADISAGPPRLAKEDELSAWLDKSLPKHATLYQGVATAVVGAPEKAGG